MQNLGCGCRRQQRHARAATLIGMARGAAGVSKKRRGPAFFKNTNWQGWCRRGVCAVLRAWAWWGEGMGNHIRVVTEMRHARCRIYAPDVRSSDVMHALLPVFGWAGVPQECQKKQGGRLFSRTIIGRGGAVGVFVLYCVHRCGGGTGWEVISGW